MAPRSSGRSGPACRSACSRRGRRARRPIGRRSSPSGSSSRAWPARPPHSIRSCSRRVWQRKRCVTWAMICSICRCSSASGSPPPRRMRRPRCASGCTGSARRRRPRRRARIHRAGPARAGTLGRDRRRIVGTALMEGSIDIPRRPPRPARRPRHRQGLGTLQAARRPLDRPAPRPRVAAFHARAQLPGRQPDRSARSTS